jgi:hypothetical protein
MSGMRVKSGTNPFKRNAFTVAIDQYAQKALGNTETTFSTKPTASVT